MEERLFVRVLPGTESIEICHKNGILGRQIIAMFGTPFSEEMNLALLHQYQIRYMVTKESGASGGFSEKISAAKKAGVSVFVIENPEAENGEQKENLEEILQEIERLTGKHIRRKQMQVSLVGIGMGNTKLITEEAAERIKGADLLFGAKRLLDAVPAQWNVAAERLPYYLAKDILPCLDDAGEKSGKAIFHAVILFSGDTGFYSGAEKMVQALQGRENTEVSVCPGFPRFLIWLRAVVTAGRMLKSSACMGQTRWSCRIKTAGMREKVFVITSGVLDVREIGKRLIECGLKETTVTVGYALSYPAEQIKTLSPEECMQLTDEGLYTCLIQNQGISGEKKNSDPKFLTHGLPDDAFCRDKVPMTKEEVREAAICKMHLTPDAVVYDIGSGTGSIAVEMARLSDNLTVYAIERKQEAVALIEKNCTKYGLANVKVICGEAPGALTGLPVPTHAFIGGSNGSLKEILTDLYRKNPRMRVVVTAITLETVGAVSSILNEFPVEQEEIIQMSVSRAKKAGRYHLMQAENPVFILSFYFAGGTES
ncbi:MAG: precorrin-6Y C5,15-methyltransferase (decarboxylating) subunit CbiT [Roseburia inulinivorans]